MTLRVALVLDGNAAGAKTAVTETTAAIDRLTDATEEATAATDRNIDVINERNRVVSQTPSVPTVQGVGPAVPGAAPGPNGNVSNVAAQLQDVFVSAQGGMNPLTVALQQGTQLSAILGAQGAAGAARTLFGALTSLVNPVSLITVGVVAAGTAAIQWLIGMANQADDANAALERHEKFLDDILEGYKDARQAAKDAFEEASRTPSGSVSSDLRSGMIDTYQRQRDAIREVSAANLELRLTELDYAETATVSMDAARQQGAALLDLRQRFADGTLSASDFHVELTKMKNNPADEIIRDIVTEMLRLVGASMDAGAQLQSLEAAFSRLNSNTALLADLTATTDAISKIKSLAPELRSSRQIARDVLNDALSSAPDSSFRTEALAAYEATIAALDEQQRRADARAHRPKAATTVSDYEREMAASRERTAALSLEIETIGKSALESERMRKTLELETAAKKDAIGLSPERIAAIAAEADASARAGVALEQNKAQFDAWASAGTSAFDSVLDAALSGDKSIGDVLGNIGRQFLKLALQMAIFNPMSNALFGGNAATFSGGIGGAIAGLFGGGRAAGGPVSPGSWYMVGENGPEPFIPSVPGTILPNHALGGGLNFRQTIVNQSGAPVSSSQRRQPDGTVLQEIVIGKVKEAMADDQFRANGLRGQTRSR